MRKHDAYWEKHESRELKSANARIAELEAEVKRLLDAIDDIEVQTAYNDSDDSVGYCVGCGEPFGCSDTCIFEIRKQFRAKYD